MPIPSRLTAATLLAFPCAAHAQTPMDDPRWMPVGGPAAAVSGLDANGQERFFQVTGASISVWDRQAMFACDLDPTCGGTPDQFDPDGLYFLGSFELDPPVTACDLRFDSVQNALVLAGGDYGLYLVRMAPAGGAGAVVDGTAYEQIAVDLEPQTVPMFSGERWCFEAAVHGNILVAVYGAEGRSVLRAYRMSDVLSAGWDPNNPALYGSEVDLNPGGVEGRAYAVEVYESSGTSYACVAMGTGGLRRVTLNGPNAGAVEQGPSQLAGTNCYPDLEQSFRDLAIANQWLYVAADQVGLLEVDLSQPWSASNVNWVGPTTVCSGAPQPQHSYAFPTAGTTQNKPYGSLRVAAREAPTGSGKILVALGCGSSVRGAEGTVYSPWGEHEWDLGWGGKAATDPGPDPNLADFVGNAGTRLLLFDRGSVNDPMPTLRAVLSPPDELPCENDEEWGYWRTLEIVPAAGEVGFWVTKHDFVMHYVRRVNVTGDLLNPYTPERQHRYQRFLPNMTGVAAAQNDPQMFLTAADGGGTSGHPYVDLAGPSPVLRHIGGSLPGEGTFQETNYVHNRWAPFRASSMDIFAGAQWRDPRSGAEWAGVEYLLTGAGPLSPTALPVGTWKLLRFDSSSEQAFQDTHDFWLLPMPEDSEFPGRGRTYLGSYADVQPGSRLVFALRSRARDGVVVVDRQSIVDEVIRTEEEQNGPLFGDDAVVRSGEVRGQMLDGGRILDPSVPPLGYQVDSDGGCSIDEKLLAHQSQIDLPLYAPLRLDAHPDLTPTTAVLHAAHMRALHATSFPLPNPKGESDEPRWILALTAGHYVDGAHPRFKQPKMRFWDITGWQAEIDLDPTGGTLSAGQKAGITGWAGQSGEPGIAWDLEPVVFTGPGYSKTVLIVTTTASAQVVALDVDPLYGMVSEPVQIGSVHPDPNVLDGTYDTPLDVVAASDGAGGADVYVALSRLGVVSYHLSYDPVANHVTFTETGHLNTPGQATELVLQPAAGGGHRLFGTDHGEYGFFVAGPW